MTFNPNLSFKKLNKCATDSKNISIPIYIKKKIGHLVSKYASWRTINEEKMKILLISVLFV